LRLYNEAERLVQDSDRQAPGASPLITLKLATLTDGLTTQAQEELDRIRDQNDVIRVQGVDALFEIEVITINDFLAKRWKETNIQWRDAAGRKNDTIRLRVEGQKIRDKSSMIFYTFATDLINAFNSFGYQLFEPNVRCQITTSRVNREIGKQIETEKGIEQFKDLNNGVTLVYSSFSERDKSLILTKPGIVNGLQTVTTLAEKYSTIPEKLREYFDHNCHILVRLYGKANVNVPTLVKATNNQNPMEPRNLRSNDPEQILLEQRFAELGWFYERKDYAWEAFTSDETSWPTLKNVQRRDFQVNRLGGRPTVRRVDNQDLAQAWVAFTGFANEAVQRKRELFIDDRFYDHVFKSRPLKHGSEYDFSFSEAKKETGYAPEAPLSESLLLSWLCNLIATSLTPSGPKHREASVARLRLSGKKREEQDSVLNDDAQYLAGLIRTSASMLFAEMSGLILFRAFGTDFYNKSKAVLNKTDAVNVFRTLDVDHIRKIVGADTPTPGPHDLFSVLWLTYQYLTDSIADDISWRNSFFQQSSRPRFLYSADMRRRLKSYVENFDARLSRLGMPHPWTGVLEKSGGLFAYVRKAIL
jgi:AIPR protein